MESFGMSKGTQGVLWECSEVFKCTTTLNHSFSLQSLHYPRWRWGCPWEERHLGKAWQKIRQGRRRQLKLQRLEGQIHLEHRGSLEYQVQLCVLDVVGSQAQQGPIFPSLPHHASLRKALSSRLFVWCFPLCYEVGKPGKHKHIHFAMRKWRLRSLSDSVRVVFSEH